EESIFPLVVDPAPTRKAAPVGRSATKGQTPTAPCLRLCWAGGKRTGSSGQRQ
ncbi:unnamed protein product, partial [Ascophyllum nodosum]